MKVRFAAVLIDALHAALEDAEAAFDRVRVDRRVLAVDVLALVCAVVAWPAKCSFMRRYCAASSVSRSASAAMFAFRIAAIVIFWL